MNVNANKSENEKVNDICNLLENIKHYCQAYAALEQAGMRSSTENKAIGELQNICHYAIEDAAEVLRMLREMEEALELPSEEIPECGEVVPPHDDDEDLPKDWWQDGPKGFEADGIRGRSYEHNPDVEMGTVDIIEGRINEGGDKLSLGIDELELSVRTYNCLNRAGIETVDDLCNMTPEDLMRIRNFGRKNLEEILAKLKELGLQLKSSEEGYTEENHPGKDKCDQLREIRKKIAEANGIEYNPQECHHKDPCKGTCPACDAEIRYLDEQLQLKKERGEEISLVGIAKEDIQEYKRCEDSDE